MVSRLDIGFAIALSIYILFSGVFVGHVHALMFEKNLKELSTVANKIVIGQVTNKQSQWEGRNIYTYVTVLIQQYIKGIGDKEKTIKVPGGSVKNIVQWVEDMPRFRKNERVVLFLDDNVFPVIGGHQGKYRIENHEVMIENVYVKEGEFINRIRSILGMEPQKTVDNSTLGHKGPNITDISPSNAPAGTQASKPCGSVSYSLSDIVINGSGFGSSPGRIVFPCGYAQQGDSDCIYSWTDSQIECHIPSNAYSGQITVYDINGLSDSYDYIISFSTYWEAGYDFETKWQKPAMGKGFLLNINCIDRLNAIQAAMKVWSDVTTEFTIYYEGLTKEDRNDYDGKNILTWDNLQLGVVAQNTIWFEPANEPYIIESDIIFNKRYRWSTTGEFGKIDIQNALVHELGHTIHLADLYGSADIEKTMYGYARKGETKKRSLEPEDIEGVLYLYSD